MENSNPEIPLDTLWYDVSQKLNFKMMEYLVKIKKPGFEFSSMNDNYDYMYFSI